MKKFFAVLAFLAVAVSFTACTEHTRSRKFGGNTTITLPKGQRLVEVTWKESSLWYLTEPMPVDYTPTVKTFQEDSRFGVFEGTVTFVENR